MGKYNANGKWGNLDLCISIANKCVEQGMSRNDFCFKYRNAWETLKRNDLLDNIFQRKKHKPYTNSTALLEGKKYNSRSEFFYGNDSAYRYCLDNGLLDVLFPERSVCYFTDNVDSVYTYTWPGHKTIYIGRSVNIYKRDKKHRDKKENDVVYRTIKKLGNTNIKVIKKNLTVKEGLFYEDYYVTCFKNKGWNVLNTAKTGVECGSTGGLGRERLTKPYCYNIAKKFKTITELEKQYKNLTQKARNKGWIKEWTWLEYPRKCDGYWDIFENCQKEARLYSKKKYFEKGNSLAYQKSLTKRKGGRRWIDIFFPEGRFRESIIVKPIVLHL